MDDEAAKRFIYRAEAVLIAVGFFASSTEAYAVLAVLGAAALVVYLAWSRMAPLQVTQPGR